MDVCSVIKTRLQELGLEQKNDPGHALLLSIAMLSVDAPDRSIKQSVNSRAPGSGRRGRMNVALRRL